MSDIKIAGVGSPILDFLVNVDESFIDGIDGDKGGMELVPPETLDAILEKSKMKPKIDAGGSAGNTIFGLANLGMNTTMIGKTGNDAQGEEYKQQFAKMGGDISHFKTNNDVPTGRCLSLITPDSERTMRTDLGAAATLSCEDISIDDFKDLTHIHIEGYMLFNVDLTFHILKLAKEANCVVSIDMASFEVVNALKDILHDLLLNYVDIIFANEEEASAFCDSSDPEVALAAFAELADTVVVKLGKDGAYIQHKDEKVKVDAGIAVAIDTTGAGDLWESGFLYGFLNGKSITESGKIGSMVADEVVQVMGASIPEERWEFIRKSI